MTLLTKSKSTDWAVFVLFLTTIFLLYYPAAHAGWVYDTTGWLTNVRQEGFVDFLNRTESSIPSLYQFTQFITYIFYHLFGANAWAWHLLMVTLHACNVFLLFLLGRRVLQDSGIARGSAIAMGGALLFAVSPYVSESLVWEAAIHYLTGVLYVFLILWWVVQYHHSPKTRYPLMAGILFFLSSYSLEIFYLTPAFVLSIALYYRFALHSEKQSFSRVLTRFLVPMAIIFAAHIVVLIMVYHRFAHLSDGVIQPAINYLVKPPKYLFHLLLLGRFFTEDAKQDIYHVLESSRGLGFFYALAAALIIALALRFKKMGAKGRFACLMLAWLAMGIFIVLPIQFPNRLLVIYDRYAYLALPFIMMLLAVLFSYLPGRLTLWIPMGAFGAANIYCTLRVCNYWMQSAAIEQNLYDHLPAAGQKTIILLNIPENLEGIPMIGAMQESEYRNLRSLLTGKTITNPIYDVASYGMHYDGDGANVEVLNDSTLQVTLNSWGTYWQYGRQGAISYQNPAYRLNMKDAGHQYEITLRQPPDKCLLLYQVGDHWNVVDMGRRGVAQY